jgi:quercetin dioxygenase-like cupin family protein
MKHAVLRPDQIKSHDRGGGARTTPLVLPSMGANTFINGITEFAASTAIPFHSHNCEESVMLLTGHAFLDIEGEVLELKPYDTTFIPPNVSHRFRNRSDSEPMKIFWKPTISSMIWTFPTCMYSPIPSGPIPLLRKWKG